MVLWHVESQILYLSCTFIQNLNLKMLTVTLKQINYEMLKQEFFGNT